MPHLALMKPGRDQILVHLAARLLWFSRRCPRNMYIFGQVLWTAGRVVMTSSSRLPGRAPVEFKNRLLASRTTAQPPPKITAAPASRISL
jgi:hypothetical protein